MTRRATARRVRSAATAALSRDQILDAAEDVLRRFGPAKATVVDVARALAVSHGSVYRHFASKVALRDAVAQRWLERLTAPLVIIAEGRGPALPRLKRWLRRLVQIKRARLEEDPEIFATYGELFAASRAVVSDHVASLTRQLAGIIADGVASGELVVTRPLSAARAVLIATGRFHDPVHAATWSGPGIDAAFGAVLAVVVRGLAAPARRPARSR